MDNNNNYNNYNNYNNQQNYQQPYQQNYQQQPYQQNYQQQPYQQNYQQPIQSNQGSGSQKSELAAFLLFWFLGGLGVHRFYVGKIGTGILWLFTCGCLGIGNLVDFIAFMRGTFTDKNGMTLKQDCPKWLKIVALVLVIISLIVIVLSFGAIAAAIGAVFANM